MEGDEPDIPRRARPRLSRMPAVPEAQGSEREALANWWRTRIEEMERQNAERIELLRTVGEHPSPVFAKIVRTHGALGMPKNLVAKLLGIGVSMLQTNYGDDYDLGCAEMISSIAANAVRIAQSTTDPQAAKLALEILSRRGGPEWKPAAKQIEMEDKRDTPPVIDSSKLTFEERQQMRTMLERIAAGGEGDPIEETE